MNAHKKFSILSFVVFLSLVLSLVFPVAAMADDSTPPPPAAPASPAVDNPPAQTSNPDSSSNVAAPADAAPASPAADNPPAQTSNPDSSSNAAAPADVASMDAAPTDAAPKDAASTEAAATDVPSSSTGVVPTDSAATDVPSNSTDVAPTNSAATNVPSSSTDVAPTESAATDVPVEPTADVVAALNNAGDVLLDENGNSVPLVSQQVADALVNGDPYFNDGAGHIVGYTTPLGSCDLTVTAGFCHHSGTPLQDAITAAPTGATISIEAGFYNEDVTIAKQIILTGLGAGATATSFTLNSGANTTGSSNIFAQTVNVNDGAIIQNGVDLAAANGGTVNVGPGNYPGQVVINNKNITVQGTAPGAVVQAVASMPTCFTTSDSNKPVICVKNATNVNIKGLTVDGAGQGNTNYRLDGIGYYNAGGTVQGNTIEHIRETPLNGDQHGVGLYAYTDILGISRTLNVFGNTIFDYQKNGMALSGNGLTVNVQNNTVTGAGPTPLTAQNGIQVSYGAIGTISGNTVSGNFWTGTYGGSNDPISDPKADSAAGILVYDPGSTAIQIFNNNIFDNQIGIASVAATSLNIHDNTIKGLPHTGNGYPAGIAIWDKDQWSPLEIGTTGTIQNNTITSNDYGVLIFNTPGGPTPIVGVHNNSITANTLFGVWSNTLTNATNNWWGNASGPHDNSVVPDACGLSLTNPTGGGNTASPCVLYDPWLTKDPFAGAGSGGDSGGNGRGQNATPIAGTVIPVTGGQLTTLSCSNPAVTMQIGDFKVTFTGLCGYDVVLNLVAKEDLPGDLGSGNSFDEGLSITLLKNGKEIKTLPVDASIQVSYPKPSSGSPSVMVWSGSAWIDQASFVDGNNIISNLAAPATLVLVTH